MGSHEETVRCLNEQNERLACELDAAKEAAEGWELEVERVRLVASMRISEYQAELKRLKAELGRLAPLAEAVGQHKASELPADILAAYRFPETSWPYLERAERAEHECHRLLDLLVKEHPGRERPWAATIGDDDRCTWHASRNDAIAAVRRAVGLECAS